MARVRGGRRRDEGTGKEYQRRLLIAAREGMVPQPNGTMARPTGLGDESVRSYLAGHRVGEFRRPHGR